LGKLIKNFTELKLNNQTFFPSGLSALDYLFLKALAIKFNVRTYLEIGSFIGESMDDVIDVVDRGISISLLDLELEEYFKLREMKNLASYFSNNKKITQYKEDSRKFDYSKLPKDIDLVFIDGDRSYEGVLSDTKNISMCVDMTNTIMVWHDFRYGKEMFRYSVIDGVFDALDTKYHDNIFYVDNNSSGIYIPDKYLYKFDFSNNDDIFYSYESTIKIKTNRV